MGDYFPFLFLFNCASIATGAFSIFLEQIKADLPFDYYSLYGGGDKSENVRDVAKHFISMLQVLSLFRPVPGQSARFLILHYFEKLFETYYEWFLSFVRIFHLV